MIPKLRRCRLLSRKEGSWRLGPQGFSIHVRQLRQFMVRGCDSLRSRLHNSREAIFSRSPRNTRTSAAKAKSPATVLPCSGALPGRSLQLCGGQQLDLGGGASYPTLRCKLCVIGVNYAWNFTFLVLPAQSGASIGETGTHSRGSCTWKSPRQ